MFFTSSSNEVRVTLVVPTARGLPQLGFPFLLAIEPSIPVGLSPCEPPIMTICAFRLHHIPSGKYTLVMRKPLQLSLPLKCRVKRRWKPSRCGKPLPRDGEAGQNRPKA